MERVINQDERIRRAEEIYARRQNLRNRTKKATLNVSQEPTKAAKLVKKVGLQIIICLMIYYIFYLINTTNYTFSNTALNTARDILTRDADFAGITAALTDNARRIIQQHTQAPADRPATRRTQHLLQHRTQQIQLTHPPPTRRTEPLPHLTVHKSLTTQLLPQRTTLTLTRTRTNP